MPSIVWIRWIRWWIRWLGWWWQLGLVGGLNGQGWVKFAVWAWGLRFFLEETCIDWNVIWWWKIRGWNYIDIIDAIVKLKRLVFIGIALAMKSRTFGRCLFGVIFQDFFLGHMCFGGTAKGTTWDLKTLSCLKFVGRLGLHHASKVRYVILGPGDMSQILGRWTCPTTYTKKYTYIYIHYLCTYLCCNSQSPPGLLHPL